MVLSCFNSIPLQCSMESRREACRKRSSTSSAAGWRERRPRGRPPRQASAWFSPRCVRSAKPPPTRPAGSRNWCAATRSRPNRSRARHGCSNRNFAGSVRCFSRRRPKARVPGGHALTVDREVFAAEVTAALRLPSPHRSSPRGNHCDTGRRDRYHLARPPHERCSGRRHRQADRLRAALLPRQHQPDCGRRVDRPLHRLPRLALRQVARLQAAIT